MLLYSELLLTKGFTFFGAKDFTFNKTQKNPARISMQKGGLDSDGREFKTAEEMWREQVGDESKKTDWYREGVGYWEVSALFVSALFCWSFCGGHWGKCLILVCLKRVWRLRMMECWVDLGM